MSEEENKHHHHHHLFGHHDQKSDEPVAPPVVNTQYSENAIPIEQTEYYDGPRRPSAYASTVVDEHGNEETTEAEAERLAEKHEKEAKHKEHSGEAIGTAAGAYALYEEHKAKKDKEHATRHKIEAKIAEAVAVGAGGYALHEHHEKKEAEEEEEAHKKKHHFF